MNVRRGTALLGAAMLASAGFATGAPAQALAPPQPAPAIAPAPQAAPAQGGPANLCQELVAYLKKPAPTPAAAAPAPPPAQSAPAGQAAAAPPAGGAQQSGPVPQGSSAPAVEAPRAGATPNPAVQSASGPQAASGLTAPVPQAANTAAAVKPLPVSIEEAEALARGNDLAGCREAAQKVRRVGAPMPPELLALAGLRLDLLQQAAPPAPQ